MHANFISALVAPVLLTGALVAQPTYNVSPAGDGCGPTLSASFEPVGANARLRVSIDGAWAGTHTLTYWGIDPISWPVPAIFGPLPVPGTTCILHTIPIWQHPALIDGNGSNSWQRAWPYSVRGHYILQTLVPRLDSQGQLELQLSNAVRVALE